MRAGRGVGFTEAPRGALFHDLDMDGEGRVERASIMTPTAQNVANLEADMRQLADKMVAGGYDADVVHLGSREARPRLRPLPLLQRALSLPMEFLSP